jgi:hypothetical protein
VWCGVVWCGVGWGGVGWGGVGWGGVVWGGVVWGGVVWGDAVWCGVVWCGVTRKVLCARWAGRGVLHSGIRTRSSTADTHGDTRARTCGERGGHSVIHLLAADERVLRAREHGAVANAWRVIALVRAAHQHVGAAHEAHNLRGAAVCVGCGMGPVSPRLYGARCVTATRVRMHITHRDAHTQAHMTRTHTHTPGQQRHHLHRAASRHTGCVTALLPRLLLCAALHCVCASPPC